ncbi:MAG: flagellar protein FlaG [Sulfurospirillum sp.]|nr:flagellar protein FlaG [Sulfurospirillum sp.]MBL0703420.1 flagellar protein FlaG [Sulfurospirillum sp.]
MEIFNSVSKRVESAIKAPVQTRKLEVSNDIASNTNTSGQETAKQLVEVAKKLNDNMKTLDTNVEFAFNDEIGIMFINVIEKNTGKMIRKIPTEEAMLLSQRMQEIIGTIFDTKG